MSISLILLHVAGAVALLLWGTRMVKLGFTRAYGTSLRQIISAGTNNRFSAFASGLGVTAILQSSTATTLLLTSFAKRGMIALPAALAVIIGADIGTTLVAQVLSLDLSWLSPMLLIIGIGSYMAFEHGGRKKHIAAIFIGLGLMLLALSLIRFAASPLQDSHTLPLILAPLHSDPILAVLLAAILTWVIHSSLAAVLLFASLATSGVLSIELGLLMVLGANIGGAFIPFIATLHDGSAVRRITLGNIIMRFAMLGLAITVIPTILNMLALTSADTARQIVNFHTGFNIALGIVFMPLVSVVAFVCEKAVPEDKKARGKVQPLYLDEKALASPVIALAGAARETLRIAETIEGMFTNTMSALESPDEKLIKKIRKADNEVDVIYSEIKLYLTRLSEESFDPKEADRYIQILTYATNLEHIGDIIDKSLMDMAEKKSSAQSAFSKEGLSEIKSFHSQVLQNMRMAQAIFMSEDPKLAAHLVAGKDDIREAANETAMEHFKRLQSGKKSSLDTSSIHLDIIRDYRRINSYITRVAYAILENAEKHHNQRRP